MRKFIDILKESVEEKTTETDENGTYYFVNGVLHREDGPAVENKNGSMAYFRHGKRNREDGPAIIYANGETQYWLDHKSYDFDAWLEATNCMNDENKPMIIKQILLYIKQGDLFYVKQILNTLRENDIYWPELKIFKKYI